MVKMLNNALFISQVNVLLATLYEHFAKDF